MSTVSLINYKSKKKFNYNIEAERSRYIPLGKFEIRYVDGSVPYTCFA